ncbi:MAG: TRAM domain-containing protein [Kiritimatiellaeota bacterium]|nr:TRAM domain-containing protein [Kiritimatiellota bacterium]
MGSKVSVLIDGVSKRNPSRWSGRSTSNKVVVFTPWSGIAKGDEVDVFVESATASTLFAKPLESE